MRKLLKRISLGTRFFAAILLLQTSLLVLLAFNSGQMSDRAVRNQIEYRVADTGHLFSIALAVPLAQRNLAAVRDAVDGVAHNGGLAYLIVRDRTGGIVAQFVGVQVKQPAQRRP